MPLVPFSQLPPDARIWVFAAERPVTGAAADRLLGEVDQFLSRWMAHGAPLTCARDGRDDRFLAIGVDPRAENASGCSIDGLFRSLRALEPQIGTTLLGGGRVHYRDSTGAIRTVSRDEFSGLASAGEVTPQTHVFDPTIGTSGEWRVAFEKEAGKSWHAGLMR